MITRHHIALTIMSTLILCSALVPTSPVVILAICTGAGIGAILPDIQMKKPHRFQVRTLAWAITRFSRILCTPLLCQMYQHLTGQNLDPGDKRLTHSVPGILFIWAVFAVFLLVFASLAQDHAATELSFAFLWGLLFGLILHLIEDLCTRKGITPVFPLSTTKVFGSIRPCDSTDRRIAQFHYYDGSVAAIILAFQYLGTGPAIQAEFICVFGLGSCLGMMILSSDVEIIAEDPKDGVPVAPPQVLLDPIFFLGKPRYPTTGLMMGVYYFNTTG
ncbi:metal-dependent hydrolase [Methanoregula sp.]|uniref:metal-dependent hydrolase n=1 Tax=Methanoregula sp. TaxID=2052170 RepID=UPI00356439A1